jgi:hypothetical protein
MTKNRKAALLLLASSLFCLSLTTASSSNLDTIGVTLLRQVTTNLSGSGIHVGQAEAQATGHGDWEVNPGQTNPAVNLPVSDFSYHSNSTATTFTNSLGTESGHADTVAQFFYGLPQGVATNVAHIDEYEADYFLNITIPTQVAISNKIVNQSFVLSGFTPSEQISVNTNYDNYAAHYGTLFISGVGDGGGTPEVSPPGTCYNGIGVGAYGTSASSVGPTTDNGRAKPDITAPADNTSDSSPLVSGAATILDQAGLRGDGGTATNSASNTRTLKALLLNGALKPIDWTNGSAFPLDARYGAGVLNVFESYKQLTGGQHAYIASSSVPTGSAHPPTSATNNISSLFGWDFNTNTSSSADDVINHYYFNLVTNTSNATFTGTATLVWNHQQDKTAINELDLYLYNVATTTLIARSSNTVDNVKHLFIPQLPTGRYDLQVFKKGGAGTNYVTASETYALAFEFFSLKLGVTNSGGSIVLTWPVYPAGFTLQSAANLNAPISWSGVNTTPVVANNQNSVTVSITAGNQFFRLTRQ